MATAMVMINNAFLWPYHSLELSNRVFWRCGAKAAGVVCSKYLPWSFIYVIGKFTRSVTCKSHDSVIQIFNQLGLNTRFACLLLASVFSTDALSSLSSDQWCTHVCKDIIDIALTFSYTSIHLVLLGFGAWVF